MSDSMDRLRLVLRDELRAAAAEYAALRASGTVTYAPAMDRLFSAFDEVLVDADADLDRFVPAEAAPRRRRRERSVAGLPVTVTPSTAEPS